MQLIVPKTAKYQTLPQGSPPNQSWWTWEPLWNMDPCPSMDMRVGPKRQLSWLSCFTTNWICIDQGDHGL